MGNRNQLTCTHPIKITKWSPTEGGLYVPCGKCTQCRIRRASEWALRATHELLYHQNSCFVRLSYDNEHLPADLAVNKNTLQLYFKRLRKRGFSIKYLACGEYGEQTGRAHYHAVIYGIGRLSADTPGTSAADRLGAPRRRSAHDQGIHKTRWEGKCWKIIRGPLLDAWIDPTTGQHLGDVTLGTLTYQSARYVAGYTLKSNVGKLTWTIKSKGKKDRIFHDGRTPPFFIVSRGLGAQYALDNRERLERTLTCRMNGRDVGMPRYYAKKLDIPTALLYEITEKNKEEIVKQYRHMGITADDLSAWVRQSRVQKAKNQEARRRVNEALQH